MKMKSDFIKDVQQAFKDAVPEAAPIKAVLFPDIVNTADNVSTATLITAGFAIATWDALGKASKRSLLDEINLAISTNTNFGNVEQLLLALLNDAGDAELYYQEAVLLATVVLTTQKLSDKIDPNDPMPLEPLLAEILVPEKLEELQTIIL